MEKEDIKRGLILINAYDTQQGVMHQSSRIKEELEKLGVETDIIRNDRFFVSVDERGAIESKLSGYDFCVYLDKDKYTSQLLEKSGMQLFNSHEAIQACDDKMTTSILLADNGVPMPKTIPGQLCYSRDEEVKKSSLDIIESSLGYPLIFKTSYGSLGKGVIKVNNREQLDEVANRFEGMPHLYQQYIASSCGRDIRIILINGNVEAAMLRKSKDDFRSNIELGGVGERIDLPRELITLSQKVARLLELDYCGVDILIGEDGYYVCEVNSNAFFKEMEQVTGVNVAGLYAKHIYIVAYSTIQRSKRPLIF